MDEKTKKAVRDYVWAKVSDASAHISAFLESNNEIARRVDGDEPAQNEIIDEIERLFSIMKVAILNDKEF